MSVFAIVRDAKHRCWRSFSQPIQVFSTSKLDEIAPMLLQIEQLTQSGFWAIGFLSYEAAPAFDSALKVKSSGRMPLLWFSIFDNSETIELPGVEENFYLGPWQPDLSRNDYKSPVQSILTSIGRGDSYQVNFTFRQRAHFCGDSFDCFLAMLARQRTDYATFIDAPEFSVCSVTPELFFLRDGNFVLTKPMKGTRSRNNLLSEDLAQAETLKLSPKDRSENVMIVDMIRNDLSRVAEDGSVRLSSLFDVEKYPTVWQMTSSVEARCNKSLVEIIGALFPCASITGAPKARTMKLISELERSPRELYCGALGLMSPGSSSYSQFSVAIRTLTVDKSLNQASYGIGSGIVWDSEPDAEFEECLVKAQALPEPRSKFALIETLLWEQDSGYFLLNEHLERLTKSANFFGISCCPHQVREHLFAQIPEQASNVKVRLLLQQNGELEFEIGDVPENKNIFRLALAPFAVRSDSIFLRHKTTERRAYRAASEACPAYDDVILWNERGEVTETCIANIAFKIAGIWYTPPVSCGLLAGVYRNRLIHNGTLKEKVLTVSELATVEDYAIVNSVRRWCAAKLADEFIVQKQEHTVVDKQLPFSGRRSTR